ncbi:hypothetical protein FBZ84_10731 [Azospirillum baldaniorum]|nr:hypothetical protein FBZ84_10731 [Azospirillum baldaniorum]
MLIRLRDLLGESSRQGIHLFSSGAQSGSVLAEMGGSLAMLCGD